jgi:hypothetical protein
LVLVYYVTKAFLFKFKGTIEMDRKLFFIGEIEKKKILFYRKKNTKILNYKKNYKIKNK